MIIINIKKISKSPTFRIAALTTTLSILLLAAVAGALTDAGAQNMDVLPVLSVQMVVIIPEFRMR